MALIERSAVGSVIMVVGVPLGKVHRLSRALIEAVSKRDFAAKLKDQGLFAKGSNSERCG